MSRLLAGLRSLVGPDDRAQAFRAEEAQLRAACDKPALDERFVSAMRSQSEQAEDSVLMGSAVADPSITVRFPISDIMGHGHTLVVGGSGTGKTYLVAGIAIQLLRRFAKEPESLAAWALDHKSEFVSLLRTLLGDLVDGLPPDQARRLVDRIVVVDPFSTSALVPLQILRPEPSVAPEVQAYELASLTSHVGGAEFGVLQDSFTFHLMLLGVTRGLNLLEVMSLLSDRGALASAALGSPSQAVREYFSGPNRIAAPSLEGVRARLHRLLRLPSMRLMLGARDCVSFRKMLEENVVLIDVGSPPLGCEDLARFWAGFVALRFARAIFERAHERAKRPVACFIDEWQEGLSGAPFVGESYERLLSMARSRGISLWLVSQSLAGAAKVSATLPRVVQTNTSLQVLFRASPDDARAMAHMLPITGRRPRAPGAPWEAGKRTPFLTPQEELQALVSEAASLPDRTCWMWNRRRSHRAVLVRAPDIAVRGSQPRDAETERRLRDGALAVPLAELERQANGDDAFRPVQPSPAGIAGSPATRRPRFAK